MPPYPAPVDDQDVQHAVDVDQLDQGPVADLADEVVDVEALDLLVGARELVVLGPHQPLQPGPLLLQVLGRLTLDPRLAQPAGRVAQRGQRLDRPARRPA